MNVGDLLKKLEGVDPMLPVYRHMICEGEDGEGDWPVSSVTVRPVDNIYPVALVIE